MPRLRWPSGPMWILFLFLFIFFICEVLIYFIVLLKCGWPSVSTSDEPLKIMILADTHLLGPREGHWFDKIRREWQMSRSYSTAMLLFNPDAVFVLGDLFDEGKWSNDVEWKYYMKRFHDLFGSSSTYAVVGNHDIGFHYSATNAKWKRFEEDFQTSSVQLIPIKGKLFVLVNSIAFEGDGCQMCREAETLLDSVSEDLACIQGNGGSRCKTHVPYTQPILMTHFPLYRQSDMNCTGEDAPSPADKAAEFRPRWECLSHVATRTIMRKIKPRVAFTAHTHSGCYNTDHGIPEWTVASFSWRNRNNPNFLLVTVSNSEFAVQKCHLPQESTVIRLYIVLTVLFVLYLLVLSQRRCSCFFRRTSGLKVS